MQNPCSYISAPNAPTLTRGLLKTCVQKPPLKSLQSKLQAYRPVHCCLGLLLLNGIGYVVLFAGRSAIAEWTDRLHAHLTEKQKKWDLAALVVSNDRRYVIQQFSVFNDPLYFLIVPVNTYIVQWLNQFTIQNDEWKIIRRWSSFTIKLLSIATF